MPRLRSPAQLRLIAAAEKVIAANAVANGLLDYLTAQNIAHTVRGELWIESLLQRENSRSISQSELRCRDFAIEFQHPELKLATLEQQSRQLAVKLSARGRVQCS